jgi:hypothetical protein
MVAVGREKLLLQQGGEETNLGPNITMIDNVYCLPKSHQTSVSTYKTFACYPQYLLISIKSTVLYPPVQVLGE